MLNYSLSDPPTPCSWTGCDEDWYDEISPITGDTNGCSFLVYYRWRICPSNPNSMFQLEMKSIELISSGNCGSTSNSAISHQAIVALLASSAGIFGLGQGDFSVTLKIPACVRRVNNFTNQDCSSQCCEKTYDLEYYNGEMKVVNQSASPTPVTCSGIGGQTCNYFCNEMEMPENETLIPFHFDEYYMNRPPIICGGPTIKTLYSISGDVGGDKFVAYYFVESASQAFAPCPKYRIQLVRIEILSTNANRNAYEWVMQVLKKVIFAVHISKGYQESHKYRILSKKCWTKIQRYNRTIEIISCNIPSWCCYRDFYVKKDPDPSNTYRIQNQDSLHLITQPIECGSEICETGSDSEIFCNVVNEYNDDLVIPRIISLANSKKDRPEIILKPNPVDNILYVIYNNLAVANSYLEIFDTFGNKIMNLVIRSINNNEFQIDMSNLRNGLYFYNLSCNNYSFQGKFIIYK